MRSRFVHPLTIKVLNFHNFVCAVISTTNKLHAPEYNGANLLYTLIGENSVVMEKK